MEYPPFTRKQPMHLALAGGFELTSAPEREYGIHHAVYRRENPEFYQTYLEYGSDLEGIQYCFWVARGGQFTLDDYRNRFATFPGEMTGDTIWGRASTLLYDRPSGRLIGACLVQMADGVPAVGYVAVHPQWRRRKLATRMIRKALTALHGQYPLVKIQVFVGNEAEAVYRNLGFEPGPRRGYLRIPAGTF